MQRSLSKSTFAAALLLCMITSIAHGQKTGEISKNTCRVPAQIQEIYLTDIDGTRIDKDSLLHPDQKITVHAKATDPNGLPIQYRFIRDGETLQEFSDRNEFTYIVKKEDVLKDTHIGIIIKNNDGSEKTPTGDDYDFISINATDGKERTPAKIQGLKILGQSGALKANDKITIQVNALDPKGLPIQYRFIRDGETLQEFSDRNEFTYIVKKEDVLKDTHIGIIIKNNDGSEKTPTGDDYDFISINATDGKVRQPANLKSVVVYRGRKPLGPIPARVGDLLTIQANAFDPQKRPIQYQFIRNGEIVQAFSSKKTWQYSVIQEDVLKDTHIGIMIKNNDGSEKTPTGDDYDFISINATDCDDGRTPAQSTTQAPTKSVKGNATKPPIGQNISTKKK